MSNGTGIPEFIERPHGVSDIAGIYGPTQPTPAPAGAGFLTGGKRALATADQIFKGFHAAYQYRQAQKTDALRAQWKNADTAYQQAQAELEKLKASPGYSQNDPRVGELDSQMRQAYDQRKAVYDEMNKMLGPTGKSGKGGKGGQQEGALHHLWRMFHDVLVGTPPGGISAPSYPEVPPLQHRPEASSAPTEAPATAEAAPPTGYYD